MRLGRLEVRWHPPGAPRQDPHTHCRPGWCRPHAEGLATDGCPVSTTAPRVYVPPPTLAEVVTRLDAWTPSAARPTACTHPVTSTGRCLSCGAPVPPEAS